LKIAVLLPCLLWVWGCEQDPVSPVVDNSAQNKAGIKLHIDLQDGFAGKAVRIRLNGQERFQALLSEAEPFAGPQASFTTRVSLAQIRLAASWVCMDAAACAARSDSADLNLGGLDTYYIGLAVIDDSLEVRVLDRPFLYF